MGKEDESGKCGKMPKTEKEARMNERRRSRGEERRRRQQGRRSGWLVEGEKQSREVGRNDGVRRRGGEEEG